MRVRPSSSEPYPRQNISLFLATTQKPQPPAPYLPITTLAGGLKLPPFLPRKIQNDVPLSYMNEEEANALKDAIFVQLDQFDECVSPFSSP